MKFTAANQSRRKLANPIGIGFALQKLGMHLQSQGLVDLREEGKAAVSMEIPMGILMGLGVKLVRGM